MSKPWEVNGKSVLVLSDAHQDLAWIRAVMEHEKGNFDRMVFNGDIIHSSAHHKLISGTRESARFYGSLIEKYDVNIGNHELPIMEAWRRNSQFKTLKNPINNASGYTKSNSLHFNRHMTWEMWRKVSLFRVVNGWLVSHAGFGSEEWGYGSIEHNLQRIWDASQEAFENVAFLPNPLFRVGPARSNNPTAPKGGPVWKDWDTEFEGDLPLPQLVGHSSEKLTVRSKGNSFNIDGVHTTYALIKDNGQIHFKAIQDGKPITPIYK
jgi:hypothetical protein